MSSSSTRYSSSTRLNSRTLASSSGSSILLAGATTSSSSRMSPSAGHGYNGSTGILMKIERRQSSCQTYSLRLRHRSPLMLRLKRIWMPLRRNMNSHRAQRKAAKLPKSRQTRRRIPTRAQRNLRRSKRRLWLR